MMVRKSKLGAAAALSAMLLLQGCTGGRGLEMASSGATRAAANDSVTKCEAESDAPEECAEHAEIEQELMAAKAAKQPRYVAR